jgi:hypothetical protein
VIPLTPHEEEDIRTLEETQSRIVSKSICVVSTWILTLGKQSQHLHRCRMIRRLGWERTPGTIKKEYNDGSESRNVIQKVKNRNAQQFNYFLT